MLFRSLARAGVAVVSAEYRLSPKVKYPAYLQDAAAAFAWTRAHIAEHGGDVEKLFVGGHSAGGYLTFMIGLDERYLREFGVELSGIAGLIPVSGQTMTHYTVREERGIGQFTITADEATIRCAAREAKHCRGAARAPLCRRRCAVVSSGNGLVGKTSPPMRRGIVRSVLHHEATSGAISVMGRMRLTASLQLDPQSREHFT